MVVVAAVLAMATVGAPVAREAGGLKVSPLFVASLGLHVLDFATRPPQHAELNPVLRPLFDEPVKLAAVKLGFALVPELYARHLESRGHKTAATVVRSVSVAAPAYGVFTNTRRKVRRGEWSVSLRLAF